MPLNITIDSATTAHNSDQSSVSSDEEDSTGTGVQVSPRSTSDSHEYSDQVEEQDGSWEFPEIGPSDSASRPRTSNQPRPIVEAPQPEHARRPAYRRHITNERARPPARTHRSPPSEPAESVDSHEEWQGGYARGPPPPHHYHNRQYPHYPQPNYVPPQPYPAYPTQSVVPAGQQQMVPYGYPPYPPALSGPTSSYFPHGHHPTLGHEMVHHAQAPGYFPYGPQGFPMPMSPPAVYQVYPTPPPPAPAPASTPAPAPAKTPPQPAPPPPPPDTSKEDEKLARLEKMIVDQRNEREAREAALEQAAKDAAAKAEADKKMAEEIATASAAAAAAAREELNNKYKAEAKAEADKAEAEKKKAEEIAAASAAAAKAAREEVEKEHKAKEEAAAEEAKAAPPPPAPKAPDKPIKFKDAIGRRFSFPFNLCKDWQGMEFLIKEAFLHVDIYGPHVANGEYDLVGPQGEIIMRHVWEIVIQPGWEISMHMWPIPEPPDEAVVADALGDIVIVDEGAPPPPPPAPSAPGGKIVDEKKAGTKKKKEKVSPFFSWTAGKPKKKAVKAKKK
ncbi:hypothetical protein ACLMJK_005868 [Lecanora helva]